MEGDLIRGKEEQFRSDDLLDRYESMRKLVELTRLHENPNPIVANLDKVTCENYFGWTKFCGGIENPDVGIPLAIGLIDPKSPIAVCTVSGGPIRNEWVHYTSSWPKGHVCSFSTSTIVRTIESIVEVLNDGAGSSEDGSTALKKRVVRRLKSYHANPEVGLIIQDEHNPRVWHVAEDGFHDYCKSLVKFSMRTRNKEVHGGHESRYRGEFKIDLGVHRRKHADSLKGAISRTEDVGSTQSDTTNKFFYVDGKRYKNRRKNLDLPDLLKTGIVEQTAQEYEKVVFEYEKLLEELSVETSKLSDHIEGGTIYEKAFTRIKHVKDDEAESENLRIVISKDNSKIERSKWAHTDKWRSLLIGRFSTLFDRWLSGSEWRMKSTKEPEDRRIESKPNIRWKLHEEILSIMEWELMESRKMGDVTELVGRRKIEEILSKKGLASSPGRVSQVMGDLHALKIIQKPHQIDKGDKRQKGYRFNKKITDRVQDDEEHYLIERLLDGIEESQLRDANHPDLVRRLQLLGD